MTKASNVSGAQARLEFTLATKNLIAQNAGYQCVVPRCQNPTVGPGSGSKPAAVGIAAHIHSAALKGPRGQGTLSDDEIRDVSNGVWCCAYHGRLIDTNQGERYAVSLLLSWRALQEAKLRRAMAGFQSAAGWIEKVTIAKSPLLEHDAWLEFSKCTTLQGPAIGKTAIAEWLSAMAGDGAPRWTKGQMRVLAQLEYSSPLPHTIDLEINQSSITLKNDGIQSALAPTDMAIVLVPENWSNLLSPDSDDDLAIGKLLGVNRTVVRNLVRDIERNGTNWGRWLEFNEEMLDHGDGEPEERAMILSRAPDGKAGIWFESMSTSERHRVMIEFGAALARTRCAKNPTLLILDASGWNIDEPRLAKYAEYFIAQPFQTLLIRGSDWSPKDTAAWSDWRRFRLERTSEQRSAAVVEAVW